MELGRRRCRAYRGRQNRVRADDPRTSSFLPRRRPRIDGVSSRISSRRRDQHRINAYVLESSQAPASNALVRLSTSSSRSFRDDDDPVECVCGTRGRVEASLRPRRSQARGADLRFFLKSDACPTAVQRRSPPVLVLGSAVESPDEFVTHKARLGSRCSARRHRLVDYQARVLPPGRRSARTVSRDEFTSGRLPALDAKTAEDGDRFPATWARSCAFAKWGADRRSS